MRMLSMGSSAWWFTPGRVACAPSGGGDATPDDFCHVSGVGSRGFEIVKWNV
jgi:hypothetical protein